MTQEDLGWFVVAGIVVFVIIITVTHFTIGFTCA